MSLAILADHDRLLDAAWQAAQAAGEIHRRYYRSADLAVEHKADASPVTLSDRQGEEAIRDQLRRLTPELGLAGEELAAEGDPRDRWIIDPLDGTKNFVAGLPYFAVLIGLELDGAMALGLVHAPVLGQSWWAARGHGAWHGASPQDAAALRIHTSSTADVAHAFLAHGGLRRIQEHGMWERFSATVATLGRTRGFGDWWGHMLVAEGRCDGMFEAAIALHDVAAVKVIVEEAGGVFKTRGNVPLDASFNEAVLSSNAPLADELAEMLGL